MLQVRIRKVCSVCIPALPLSILSRLSKLEEPPITPHRHYRLLQYEEPHTPAILFTFSHISPHPSIFHPATKTLPMRPQHRPQTSRPPPHHHSRASTIRSTPRRIPIWRTRRPAPAASRTTQARPRPPRQQYEAGKCDAEAVLERRDRPNGRGYACRYPYPTVKPRCQLNSAR